MLVDGHRLSYRSLFIVCIALVPAAELHAGLAVWLAGDTGGPSAGALPAPAADVSRTERVIPTTTSGVRSSIAMDLHGEGDVDVLSASSTSVDKIAWYENRGPPFEACCHEHGCQDLPTDDCLSHGGISQGPGTDCALTACSIPGDFDGDGDVDLDDHAVLVDCLRGQDASPNPMPPITTQECLDGFDFDHDDDVDMFDYTMFQDVFTGQ